MSGETLILNAGSSSLKFSIYIDGDEIPEVSGLIDRIGAGAPAEIKLKDAAGAPLSAGVTARETSREIGWSRGGLGVAAFSRRNAGNQPGLSDRGAALTWKAGF